MASNYEKKMTNPHGKGEISGVKIRIPMYLHADTLKAADELYPLDNCTTRTEFLEKAVKFYIGYLGGNKSIDYFSPKLIDTVDSVIKGSEKRINRNLFKVAVELGKILHLFAAANKISDKTVSELHSMCVDEVQHINGLIDFENAVEFQRSE